MKTGIVACYGELLLRLGAPGRQRLLQSPVLDVHIGGAEANVAVSLSQWGHAVRMIGRVSANALGDAASGELRRHGVDTSRVEAAAGRMGLYFLTTGALQRPSEVIYDRADSAFARGTPADYDWPALLDGAGWLHLSGVTPALGAAVAQTAIDAARTARRLGLGVSFDGNFRPQLWQAWQGNAPGILRQLMEQATVLFADHRDIAVVLGLSFDQAETTERNRAAASAAFEAFPGLRHMACTLRQTYSVDHQGLGAMLFNRNGEVHLAPERTLSAVVDRIGGGDAFAAGILHGLFSQLPDAETLGFGLAAGCLKHSIEGDFNRVSQAEVHALMGEDRLDVRR
ncbi:sugar kinase [Pseudoxanthomonas sp.]|uniref:sugar kinase n=1 Tax=Pseudoxanthomonas sp. TaxID=1871049 RepID=UPI00260EB020|nr:sugar kinase [Pseudoxanthomonas sp.]WDS35204.1 MAG: sugar kinase [Pseudoxanthomonas sp.]